jgi:SAM-dependent methyltransferase
MSDVWAVGASYERFMGRWSRRAAAGFLTWLAPEPGGRWLDVGCGTGALTAAVLGAADPSQVAAVDTSAGFVAAARAVTTDPRAGFDVADARALPFGDDTFDVAASGLVLNFVPDPSAALAEIARVVRPGGTVAAYVWDYAEGMQLLRYLWDAATAVDPAAAALDEGPRFPLCHPQALAAAWTAAGLGDVGTAPVTVDARCTGFDDYWEPFLGGQGPAGSYVASLPEPRRRALADEVRRRLPVDADGSLPLTARAWAVRGRVG